MKQLLPSARIVNVPKRNDITDYVMGGDDLSAWLSSELRRATG